MFHVATRSCACATTGANSASAAAPTKTAAAWRRGNTSVIRTLRERPNPHSACGARDGNRAGSGNERNSGGKRYELGRDLPHQNAHPTPAAIRTSHVLFRSSSSSATSDNNDKATFPTCHIPFGRNDAPAS